MIYLRHNGSNQSTVPAVATWYLIETTQIYSKIYTVCCKSGIREAKPKRVSGVIILNNFCSSRRKQVVQIGPLLKLIFSSSTWKLMCFFLLSYGLCYVMCLWLSMITTYSFTGYRMLLVTYLYQVGTKWLSI